LGCGMGYLLREIGSVRQDAELIGIDISVPNIELARSYSNRSRDVYINYILADYMNVALEPFDLIVSDSTLQLISQTQHALFGKIAAEIRPGGFLLVTLPNHCFYNTLLLAFRTLLRRVDVPATRRLLLQMANLVYKGYPDNVLKDRINYQFVLPNLKVDLRLLNMLYQDFGFDLVWSHDEDIIIGKLRHSLLCMVRK